MKKATKHLFQSSILACTLLLFLAFSSGLSFSLHFCDSCKQTKLFFFQHPNCCSESTHVHEMEKTCTDEHCDCCATHVKHQEESCRTAHHCCNTTHKYIRIASPFVYSIQAHITPACVDLFADVEITSLEEPTTQLISISNSDPPPLLTKAGDSSYLHFVSQNILYA